MPSYDFAREETLLAEPELVSNVIFSSLDLQNCQEKVFKKVGNAFKKVYALQLQNELPSQLVSFGWMQRLSGQIAGVLVDFSELRGAAGHLLDELRNLTFENGLKTYFDLLRSRTIERILDK